ncbi:rab9 effector protein with kelch motifs isoform X5 [Syngnathoides biaculeatus]|uniref:rab9 effector protein with kelch motifs isoform X5 n=1 Tax=Syngnathoides biaculeatus TaxID=300417 RepID=UPI002ADDE1DD|nr:rab9 effector protein with kelch motifs isoform X5 [Syngnathoides biaculeatus]
MLTRVTTLFCLPTTTAMQILPKLEAHEKPKQGIWYSLVPSGRSPSVSVGHTCTYWPDEGGHGRIFIVGGANPGGSFSHTHAINLEYLKWDTLPWEGLKARYEHCTLVPGSPPQSLWVFGGAEQSGNHNCIQKINVAESKAHWENVTVSGEPPSPRTYHTNSACVGSSLYVFSGGEVGASPVSDQKLYIFDTVSSTWAQPETQGTLPPVRHGHVIVAAGLKIYIHGGMANDAFLDDMYSLDLRSWGVLEPSCQRAGGGVHPELVASQSQGTLRQTDTLTITPRGNLECRINVACFSNVGGNWSARRKPTQAWGEHANSTQAGPGLKLGPQNCEANALPNEPPCRPLTNYQRQYSAF